MFWDVIFLLLGSVGLAHQIGIQLLDSDNGS